LKQVGALKGPEGSLNQTVKNEHRLSRKKKQIIRNLARKPSPVRGRASWGRRGKKLFKEVFSRKQILERSGMNTILTYQT